MDGVSFSHDHSQVSAPTSPRPGRDLWCYLLSTDNGSHITPSVLQFLFVRQTLCFCCYALTARMEKKSLKLLCLSLEVMK